MRKEVYANRGGGGALREREEKGERGERGESGRGERGETWVR